MGRKQWIGKECGGKGKTALSTDIKRRGGIGSIIGIASCGQG